MPEGKPAATERHWIRFALDGTGLECSPWLSGRLGAGKPPPGFRACFGDGGAAEAAWNLALVGQPQDFAGVLSPLDAEGGGAQCRLFLERGRCGAPVGVLALLRLAGEGEPGTLSSGESSLLARAFEASPHAAAIIHAAGRAAWGNEALGMMLGLRLDEIAGQSFAGLVGTEEEGELRDRLAQGDAFAMELTAKHASGYEFRMRLEGSPLPTEVGGAPRFVVHCANVDHLRAAAGKTALAEGASTVSADSLGNLDRALTALRREVNEIRRESESKTEFLANISHEIRTPMNAVVGFCDLLLASELSDEQGEYVQAIYHSGQLLIQLIGQVLDYSKIASGHLELLQEEVDLEQVFLEAQSFMGTRARSKGLKFEVEMSGVERVHVIGDSTRIKQVVINLLGNAYKFTRRGRIGLTVRCEPSVREGHARVEVKVEDTGIGIDSNRIPNLFRPFAQGDARASREFGGSGLGLAISKQLCKAMNGNVWLDRTSGEGSVFAFELSLPLAHAEPRAKASADRPPEAEGADAVSPHRILVVDDNPNNLLITLKLSEHLGYKATAVRSGVEALEALRAKDIAIVLMDVRMAPINGMETTQRIRGGEAGPSNANVYIIALTAHALQGDRDRCIECGMNDYLSKPLTLEMLSEALKRAETSLAT